MWTSWAPSRGTVARGPARRTSPSHGGRRGDDEDRESGGEGSGSDGGNEEPAITDSLIKDALQAIVGAYLKLRIPQKSERPPGPGGTQKGIKKKDYRLLGACPRARPARSRRGVLERRRV